MAEERTPRSKENREETARPSDAWVPSSTLPTPNPRDGWVFRWVRTASLGNVDNTNVSKKLREGWEPVAVEDVPELQVMSDVGSRFKGNVEVGGLLLCKARKELVDQRNAHYQQVAELQKESVDEHYMKDHDPRMPRFQEKKTRTSFGNN